jgi:predicted acyl esterase
MLSASASLLAPIGVHAQSDPTAWFTYSRPAQYSAVYSFVQVPMRDGNNLACDLQQPGSGTPGQLDNPGSAPAPGRFPGIIDNYTPYVAANPASATTANPLAALGYDVLNCDPRGLGRSQATAAGQTWTQPYATLQTQDNYDMIEWLAAQPFSNGRIGQTGGSAGAQTSTLVAALNPPHLLAIVSITAADNMYSDSRYKGGAFVAWGPDWAALCGALSYGGCNTALIDSQYAANPLDNAYWQQQSVDNTASTLKVPDLQLEGWQDTDFPTGAERIFQETKSNNHEDSGTWVLQGPWGHAGSPACTPSGGCGVTLAWFDHYLMQLPGAPLAPARVEMAQMPTGTKYQLFDDWPPPASQPLDLRLNSGTTLETSAGVAGSNSYTVSATDPATAGTPAEQTSQFLRFESAPLPNDVAVVGNPLLHLIASLTATDGIFVAQLEDVAPDGTTTFATGAPWYLKASHRLSNSSLTPVVPGQVAPYNVPTWAVDWLFPAGHRIALKIASAVDVNPPATSPGPNTMAEVAPSGTVTLSTGQGGSFLELPVLPSTVPSVSIPEAGVSAALPLSALGVLLCAALAGRRHRRWSGVRR